MNIDFRQDAADLQAFIGKTLGDYGSTPSSDRGAHDPITRIGLWFWLGDGGPGAPYVAIQLDTRPDAEPDGEWTFEHFAMLERPHWREAFDAHDAGEELTITFRDGSSRKLRNNEMDQVFGDFCVDVLKSTAAAGLLIGPHIAPGCEMDVECDDFHYYWPDFDDRGVENMANPAENGRRRESTPPRPDSERAQDDARLYDVRLIVPPTKDRKAAIAGAGNALGIGAVAARELIDSGRVLAELVDAREVIRLGKLLRAAGLDIRVEPFFRWGIS